MFPVYLVNAFHQIKIHFRVRCFSNLHHKFTLTYMFFLEDEICAKRAPDALITIHEYMIRVWASLVVSPPMTETLSAHGVDIRELLLSIFFFL
jgi:hypothetical protein